MQKLEKKEYVAKVSTREQKVQKELERQVGGPMYNIALLVMISPLQSPSSFECEEGKNLKEGLVQTKFKCWYDLCDPWIYL